MSEPSQNPLYKNWKSQAQRTKDSERKVLQGVDALRPYVGTTLGKLTRAQILNRAKVRLAQHHGPITNPEHLLHFLATTFVETLEFKQGSLLSIETVWEKLLGLVYDLKPEIAAKLNNDHFKALFTWQLAGHVALLGSFMDPIDSVLNCKHTKGPRKGKTFIAFKLKTGEVVSAPKNYRPGFPVFLCPGNYWDRKPVFSYCVANAAFPWPCPELKRALKIALWEPPAERKTQARR